MFRRAAAVGLLAAALAVPAVESDAATACGYGITNFVSMTWMSQWDATVYEAPAAGSSATAYATVNGAILLSSLALSATSPIVAQSFDVTMSIGNAGCSSLLSVVPQLAVTQGAGLVSLVAGPSPASVPSFAAGSATAYVWTFSVTGYGTVGFSVTVTGYDPATTLTVTGAPAVTAIVSPIGATVAVGAAAPANSAVGQSFTVTMTVTNSGVVPVNGVRPYLGVGGGGAVTALGGPAPPGPVSLTAGASQTFAWTFSATGAGPVSFTVTAIGTDALLSGTVVAAATAVTNVFVPASLAAAAAVPAAVESGQGFTVAMTVTNTGGTTANGVQPSLSVNVGSGLIAALGGPAPPGPVSLSAGASQTFAWTFSATGAGPVSFTVTAIGTDAISLGTVLASAVRGTTVFTPASLAASLSLSPPQAMPGGTMVVRLTVTNTGGVPVNGLLPTVPLVVGPVSLTAGPAPAGPAVIAPGAAVTFAWSYSVSGSGGISFSATADGADALTAAPVSAGAWVAGTAYLAAVFNASLAVTPATAPAGTRVTVVLNSVNSGTQDANSVSATLIVTAGQVILTPVSSPVPVSATTVLVGGGPPLAFIWSFDVLGGEGPVGLAATVGGLDLGTGGFVLASASGTFAVPPARLLTMLHALGQTTADVVPFPNPVPAGTEGVNLAVRLAADADTMEVEVYNGAIRLVQRRVFAGVRVADGGVVLDGIRNLAPGVYLLRVKATSGGATRTYPLARVVVE